MTEVDIARKCSYAQRWLLTLDSLVADRSEYNVYQAVRVRGRLEADRLWHAVELVSERHELLRTIYRTVDGVPEPVVLPVQGSFCRQLHAMSVDEAVELATELVARPFDLATERPIRIWAIAITPDDWLVVLCMHHICTDAWSMGILWRELSLAYEGESLPPPPVAHAELVRRENEFRASAAYAEQVEYWRHALGGLTSLDIPADRPRPALRSGRGAQVDLDLPAELSAQVVEFAHSQRATVFTVALAAFALVLSRWAGRFDIPVGTVVSSRSEEDTDSAIGYLVNTVVLCTEVDSQLTVADFVRQVRDRALDGLSHPDVPFAELVERFDAVTDPSRNPYFDVMITMEDDATEGFRARDLVVESVKLPTSFSKFDLSLMLTQHSNALSASLAYATDLFGPETAARLGAHIVAALREFCDRPDSRLATVSTLGAGEHHRLVEEWNDTTAPIDTRSIHEIFADIAQGEPNAPAVYHGSQVLTYGELDDASSRLATRLRRMGAGRNTRVALRLSRSPDLLVALLAVLKSGAAYVPVDPAMPPERSALVLANSKAAIVLTEDDLASLDSEHVDAGSSRSFAGEPAYVMYTSGSTGTPKGVMISHGAVVNLSMDYARMMRLGPGEIVAAVAPYSFDMSVAEMITPLLAGAAVRLVSWEAAHDAGLLAAELREVSFAQLTPVHWQMLLDSGWSDPRLRAGCGAETFPPALAVRLSDAVADLWNFYGPTETTVWSTAHRVEEREPGRPVPVGTPLANTVALVLDDHFQPVPIGVPGELFLGGAGIALGYDGAPGLTADRFVPDPFHAGRRLYRTGDVVRWLSSGRLEFNSRNDDQVKVRGFRIELGEVESALERHADVVKAAVVPRGEGTDRIIVAFVVLRGDQDTAAVRRFVAGLLPQYMIPSVLVPLADLPSSPNGKLDRKRLPQHVDLRTQSAVEPRNEQERLVADAFRVATGITDVSVKDDFFALGGHSLTAVQVVSALRPHADGVITVQTLFAHSTVESLARWLTETPRAVAKDTAAALVDGSESAPLSFAQQRLWMLNRFAPDRTDYTVQRVLRLSGPLDTDALEQALHSVAHRHEVLRSRIVLVDGTPRQIVGEDAPPLVRTDLSGPDALDRALSLAAQDIDIPFDVEHGPLWRARIIRLNATDHVLVLVFQHSIVDGQSFPLLWRDLAAAYRGEPLAPLPLQYGAYARTQRATPIRAEDVDYWRQQLSGHSGSELATDRPRPPIRSGNGTELFFPIGAELFAAIRDLARATGGTVFGVAFAAFAATVSRFCGSSDVIVGTPVSTRDRPELGDLIGCFINTLVLRVDCAGDPSFRQLLSRVHTTTSQAQTHQSLPFEQLVDELGPIRDASRNPLFQIMFAVADGETVRLPHIDAEPLTTSATTAKFDINVELQSGAHGHHGSIVWDTDLYDRATVERFAACYIAVLRDAVQRPDTQLSALAQVDAESGPEGTTLPTGMLDLIRQATAAHSHRVALQCGESVLRYAELDHKSSQVSTWLRRRGVRAGSVISVVAGDTDLPVLMLGVVKAGAAFLPIDPGDPADYIRRLQQAGGAVLELRRFDDLTDLTEPADEQPEVPADALIGVYFTSGSTGPAKAVQTLHRGVAHFFRYLTETAQFSPDDVILQIAAPGFDASLRDMFGPLTAGSRVVLLPPGARRDAYRILETIQEASVTAIVSIVPSMLTALVTAARGRTADLRLILVSGEPLTAQQVAAAAAWAPKARIINQYGPSECTMTSTFHEVTETDVATGVIPIGVPIADTRAYVVGRNDELLPSGALGELCLAGPGVTRGYGSAARTAERFVPDPYEANGERMFRTGDLVHRRHDGKLVYHGRNDTQVKIRGVRIEPAEVETAIAHCAGVVDCAVTLNSGDLVAYLVGDAEIATVRAELATILPVPLRPTQYVRLAELPRLSNGKLDRRNLPAPDREARTSALAARDRTELLLVTMWESVLGVPGVGVRDDFFALGGNSLKAVELADAMHSELEITMPLHMLFTNPTVEELAVVLPTKASRGDDLVVQLRQGPDEQPPLFLIHPQSGEVCSYLDVSRKMDVGRAILGIEAVGYNTDHTPLDRIEDMAEHYLAQVRRVQADGPYLFAGWSFGGNVAFEMARQVEAAGNEVAFLGVIDARAFGEADLESWYMDKDTWARFGLVAGLPAEQADSLATLQEHQVLNRLLEHGRSQGRVSNRANSETMRRMIDVFTANGRAAEAYRTEATIAADVDLFRASQQHLTLTNPMVDPCAWQARTRGQLSVHQVDGTHHDLLAAPNADRFAAHFARALASRRAA